MYAGFLDLPPKMEYILRACDVKIFTEIISKCNTEAISNALLLLFHFFDRVTVITK